MRERKDSGIEWIGEIPKDWKVHPVYVYFEEGKVKNYRLQEQNLLSLSYGRIIRKDINTNGGLLPASFNTYNVINVGDIIIRPTDLQNDKRSLRTGLVKEQGIITSAYIDLRPKENINSAYYHYLLHSYDITKVFYNMGNGVRQGLNFSEFAKLLLLEPTKAEQQRIVDFLDTQCSEIDATAEDIRKEISLLEDYKKSVITEAVTKGLNPDAEMKDSGIEWIGEIPKGWKVPKIKYVAKFLNGDRGKNYPSGNDLTDSGIVFLTSNNIREVVLDCTYDITKYITEKRYNILGGAKIRKNDIIFCLRGSVGNCAINKTENEGTIASSLVDIRPIKVVASFLNYCLKSDINSIQTSINMNGSCAANLSAENVANYCFIEPSISEQQQIADYLDSKCSEIDSLIADKKRQLDILADYKRSLIYEYITGKKEVPVNE